MSTFPPLEKYLRTPMLVTKIQSSTEPFCGPIILLQQITQIYRAVLPELF